MKKKQSRSLMVSPPALYTILVLLGFGAGYSTHEFVFNTQRPIPTQQHPYSAPVQNSIFHTPIVCFTPNKQCQTQLIGEINKAQKSIYVQAYSFTDRDISGALVSASKRGVLVKILLDKSNQNDHRSAKDLIVNNNIPLRFDYPPGIAHNKVMIIDEVKVISGSYNFSASAYKRNTENLLTIMSKPLAQQYLQNWQKRWVLSKEGANTRG